MHGRRSIFLQTFSGLDIVSHSSSEEKCMSSVDFKIHQGQCMCSSDFNITPGAMHSSVLLQFLDWLSEEFNLNLMNMGHLITMPPSFEEGYWKSYVKFSRMFALVEFYKCRT